MPTINEFPTELVLVIFGYIDPKTMIIAGSICRRWYKLYRLPEQQYKIAQYRYSVVDGPPNNEWPPSRRLEALQAFQARWRTFSWVKSHTFDIHTGDQWECFSGVYGNAGRSQNWITFNKAPSIMTDSLEAMWSINVPIPIRDFSMDSHQDLVVVMNAENQRSRRDIHFLSMCDGKPHPRAKNSMVSEDLPSVWPYHSGCSIEINGERVAILFTGTSYGRRSNATLVVWNWESGEKLVHVISDEIGFLDSFCFLSTDHVLVGRRALDDVDTPSCLEMYDFSNGLQHVTMRRFELPRVQSGTSLTSFELLCEATPRPAPDTWRPFYTSPANRICMITTYYHSNSVGAKCVNYIVFASTLLGLFSSEDLHPEAVEIDGVRHISTVPWKAWNPQTCVTYWESRRSVVKVVTCGTRIVCLTPADHWGPSRIQIHDFNPYSRHHVQNESGTKGDETMQETQEGLDVDHVRPVDRTQGYPGLTVTHEYVGPHLLPMGSLFGEPVYSALPYLETTTVEELAAHFVMMDFENIYLLHNDKARVLSF